MLDGQGKDAASQGARRHPRAPRRSGARRGDAKGGLPGPRLCGRDLYPFVETISSADCTLRRRSRISHRWSHDGACGGEELAARHCRHRSGGLSVLIAESVAPAAAISVEDALPSGAQGLSHTAAYDCAIANYLNRH